MGEEGEGIEGKGRRWGEEGGEEGRSGSTREPKELDSNRAYEGEG